MCLCSALLLLLCSLHIMSLGSIWIGNRCLKSFIHGSCQDLFTDLFYSKKLIKDAVDLELCFHQSSTQVLSFHPFCCHFFFFLNVEFIQNLLLILFWILPSFLLKTKAYKKSLCCVCLLACVLIKDCWLMPSGFLLLVHTK